MKVLHDNIALNKLFEIPESYSMSQGDKNYIGSLTPKWNLLKSVQNISITVSLETPASQECLDYQNNVNVHLFKPKFYQLDNNSIECYVPNAEVSAHTLRSLYISCHHLGVKNISVTVKDLLNSYSDFASSWKVHDNIIVCRIESFLNFLRILWLKKLNIKEEDIKEYVVNFELSRIDVKASKRLEKIKQKIETKYNVNFEEFHSTYKIIPQITKSPYVISTNLVYDNTKITLVQLTWGYSQSQEMFNFLIKQNPNIKKFGCIGGVGYSGTENVQVDDIFLPTSIMVGNSESIINVKTIRNELSQGYKSEVFNGNAVHGTIRTVVPQIGVFSNTKFLKSNIEQIHAFDMELEAFVEKLEDFSNITYAFSYYIMDLPFEGMGLGQTYYNKEFLKKLYSRFNRGKYHCFESILNFISK